MRFIGNDPKTPRQTQVVASGTLSTGDTVVVNSDGTVSAVAGTSVSESSGTAVNFVTPVNNHNIAFDSTNNKVIITYLNRTSSIPFAVIGTVSGSSISFGTPAQIDGNQSDYTSVAYDPVNDKFAVFYGDYGSSEHGYAKVGTISGTSITFGTATSFYTNAAVKYMSSVYDPDTGKIITAFGGQYDYGYAVVGTISGTSISFGTVVAYRSSRADWNAITYDTANDKIVIVYSDNANSSRATGIVGTVSGTSLSFGSQTNINTSSSNRFYIAYDSANEKVVATYTSTSTYGYAAVGTVSGTSISFGTEVQFSSGVSYYGAVSYHAASGKIVIPFRNDTTGGSLKSGTVSGTSISFDPELEFETQEVYYVTSVYDSNAEKTVIAYSDSTVFRGYAVVYEPSYSSTNITAENFIGTAQTGASDGNRAVINITGAIDENQSGLTAGQSYYVQNDGSLGTTAADPSVFAGTAVSATKLIVKG